MIWPYFVITAGASYVLIRGSSMVMGRAGFISRAVAGPLTRSTKRLPLRLKGFENPMSLMEAYRILNLPPIASKARVRDAHRQLMLRNHPDNGGSNYVASKVNEAKELICGDTKD